MGYVATSSMTLVRAPKRWGHIDQAAVYVTAAENVLIFNQYQPFGQTILRS